MTFAAGAPWPTVDSHRPCVQAERRSARGGGSWHFAKDARDQRLGRAGRQEGGAQLYNLFSTISPLDSTHGYSRVKSKGLKSHHGRPEAGGGRGSYALRFRAGCTENQTDLQIQKRIGIRHHHNRYHRVYLPCFICHGVRNVLSAVQQRVALFGQL